MPTTKISSCLSSPLILYFRAKIVLFSQFLKDNYIRELFFPCLSKAEEILVVGIWGFVSLVFTLSFLGWPRLWRFKTIFWGNVHKWCPILERSVGGSKRTPKTLDIIYGLLSVGKCYNYRGLSGISPTLATLGTCVSTGIVGPTEDSQSRNGRPQERHPK